MALTDDIRAALKASDDAEISYMKAMNQIVDLIPQESREMVMLTFVYIDHAAEDMATNKRGSKTYKRAQKYLRYIEKALPECSTNPDAVHSLLKEYLQQVDIQRNAYMELDRFRSNNPAAYELTLDNYLAEFNC